MTRSHSRGGNAPRHRSSQPRGWLTQTTSQTDSGSDRDSNHGADDDSENNADIATEKHDAPDGSMCPTPPTPPPTLARTSVRALDIGSAAGELNAAIADAMGKPPAENGG
jgi:hypothetical protein